LAKSKYWTTSAGLSPASPARPAAELTGFDVAGAQPDETTVGGFEIPEDPRGDRERHDALLGSLEFDLDGGGRFVPAPTFGLRLLGDLS
jgi:hypothetical protein